MRKKFIHRVGAAIMSVAKIAGVVLLWIAFHSVREHRSEEQGGSLHEKYYEEPLSRKTRTSTRGQIIVSD
ncbi:hypothetical protein TNCV_113821 [Trichonephila clavipes]|nr:hypothetical protein TNCV_113821 [Trichonephila clavipes]